MHKEQLSTRGRRCRQSNRQTDRQTERGRDKRRADRESGTEIERRDKTEKDGATEAEDRQNETVGQIEMGQKRQTGTTRQKQKTDGPNQWERDTTESQVRHMEAKTKTAKQRQKTDRPRQWDRETEGRNKTDR